MTRMGMGHSMACARKAARHAASSSGGDAAISTGPSTPEHASTPLCARSCGADRRAWRGATTSRHDRRPLCGTSNPGRNRTRDDEDCGPAEELSVSRHEPTRGRALGQAGVQTSRPTAPRRADSRTDRQPCWPAVCVRPGALTSCHQEPSEDQSCEPNVCCPRTVVQSGGGRGSISRVTLRYRCGCAVAGSWTNPPWRAGRSLERLASRCPSSRRRGRVGRAGGERSWSDGEQGGPCGTP